MNKTRLNLARAAMTLFLALFGSLGASGEDGVITVGEGGRASGYLPCYPNNTYSMSQQIYTSDEIGNAGLITSIAFYNYEIGSGRECDIYLSHTNKVSFDNATDWVVVASEDKVFSGKMILGSGWTVIDFDTPFQYDGTQNLLLTVDDNTGKDTGYNFSIGVSDVSSNQSLYYYKMFGTPVNLDPTQAITEEGTVYSRKNHIKLCFETYPKPYKFEAVEIGDVSAQIQCSLRGDATAWNLRYRKVAGEGEEEQRWNTPETITDRSYTIEDLTPSTKYEVQVQAVFPAEEEGGEDHLSAWTEPLFFTTSCCPVEEQTDVMFALNSYGGHLWYDYAVQIVDVTNQENPVEVAHLSAPSGDMYGGTIKLCCGHNYKVNWIQDTNADHADLNKYYSFALYYNTGDKLFIMNRGEAPNETSELTTFVMDCTPYCAQMPQTLSVTGTTYESATITFVSETKKGQVVYSTEADFDPETATPKDVDFEELPESDDPWGGNPPNASLTLKGLQPLTEYYVRVRSVCTAEPIGTSRWSEPVKVTTGSRYDAPTQVIAEPVNSRTEKTSWGSRGTEKGYNLYYRKQAAGNPVDPSAIETFGGGNGKGFGKDNWGDGIWDSYGDRPFSNTLFVSNVPAGSSFGFKAGNGKTGAGLVKFLYGMQKQQDGAPLDQMKKFDKKCLNDADRAAIIKGLVDKMNETTDEELIAALRAEIEELKSLPTDAQKLARMKELEQNIEDIMAELESLALKKANGEISEAEYESQKAALEAQNTLYGAELSELRAITTNAENPQKDGFSVSREKETANARTRGDNTYIFFIRHSDPNGVLLVTDLTITPPEQVGEWTVIKNLSKTEYSLTGLEPGTAYEVMVEPVYADGTTGSQSPITVFVTIGTETDPSVGVFSVSKGKKVQFARGNLRYEGDIYGYESEWTMAKQQYEVLGEENIDNQGEWSFQKYPTDLLCWSTTNNYYGVSTYYWWEEDDIVEAFKGNFVEWGENPTLISQLGAGWRTLSKDEWNYLLNERANAAQLKQFATIAIDEENKVKGLVLIPDEWTAPDGVVIGDEMNLEQWAAVEQTGVVFLPVTGHLWTWKDDEGHDQASVNGLDMIGNYWSSTPSSEDPDVFAFALNFNDPDLVPTAEMERRLGCAVRLVKEAELPTSESITIGKYGKATYCSNYNLDFSTTDEVKAYVATGYEYQGESSTIWMTRVKDVPAGTPFVLKGNQGSYPIPVKASSASYYKNLLVRGIGESITATDGAGHRNYVMSGGKFVAVGSDPSSPIGTNKCYLQLPETMNPTVAGAAQSLALAATGTGKTTYCAPVDLDFTDVAGLIAYSATGYDNSTGTIWLTRVKKVSAGEGLLLKGTAGGNYTIPSVGIQSYYANMIVGNNGTAGISINPTDGDFTNYVLSGGKFVALGQATNIPVGKAYLQIPSVVLTRAADAAMPEFYGLSDDPEVISMVVSTCGIDGDGETTGIKATDNGKIKIDNNAYYNLQGQRVEKPGKGLYIHNGQKVLIK